MTYLAAATTIDTLGRKAAPSMNPEMDMVLAARSVSRSGGLVSWLRQTAIVKALTARKAERDLNVAVKRLADLSPHLLADIGMLDLSVQPKMQPEEMPQTDVRIALPPVALRPAQRPAIQVPQRAPARSTTKPPVRAARKEQRVAQ
jgi:hypothetical protein